MDSFRELTDAELHDYIATKARLAAIVESSDDAIISKNLQGVILTWNRGAERLFGYSAEEMIGLPVSVLIPSERHDEEPRILDRIARGESVEHYETIRRRKDGTLVHISLSVSPIFDDHGKVIGASKIARDITERKRAEDALRRSDVAIRKLNAELDQRVNERTAELLASQRRLRELASDLNIAEQRERKRLAGELHDYLGQLLALSRIKLGQAKRETVNDRLATILNDLQGCTDKAIEYTRSLIAQLSPPVLHEFGLAMALDWLAEQMAHRDLKVTIASTANIPKLPETQALLLFQSVRELLINVAKHGGTDEASIDITASDELLQVMISDQGAGFDPSILEPGHTARQGFGLFSIQERMTSLNGSFRLASTPGKGTQVTLAVPLPSVSAVASAGDTKTDRVSAGETFRTPERLRDSSTDLSDERPAGSRIRVVIADDHVMIRQHLGNLLRGHDDIGVIGEAANGAEAAELAATLLPDVIVMDVTMPTLSGVEATRLISKRHPDILIIGVSVHGAEQVEAKMKQEGAVAFVSKEAVADQLYPAIKSVVRMKLRHDSKIDVGPPA